MHRTMGEHIWTMTNMFQAVRVLNEAIEERLQASAGVSLAEGEVLWRLHQHGPRLQMRDLADLLLFSQSGVTRLVDRLEKEGLVARELSSEDRRVTYAVLTKKGLKRIERYQPVFHQAVGDLFARHLDRKDVTTLREILRKVLEGNGCWDERRCAHHAKSGATAVHAAPARA